VDVGNPSRKYQKISEMWKVPSGNLAEFWDNFEEIGYQFSDKII
jgi:hypothetical protein